MAAQGEIGLFGLGPMGRNLALNLADYGQRIYAFDSDPAVRAQDQPEKLSITVCNSLVEVIDSLKPPMTLLLMVPAGKPVDQTLQALMPFLAENDVVVDCGNSHWRDTERRQASLRDRGVHWMGAGLSGGPEGARRGPAIMVGGPHNGWRRVGKTLEAIAARAAGTPCCAWLGEGGAGHFVKTIHNGIEYADMQLIAEVATLMQRLLGLGVQASHEALEGWRGGPLKSYLLDIAAEVMGTIDPDTKRPLIQVIVDRASEKGTGRWAAEAALEMGAPAPTISEAVAARAISARRQQRATLAKSIAGPTNAANVDRATWLPLLHDALFAGRLITYAQGFAVLDAARKSQRWRMELARVAELWRAGCIIRSSLLDDVAVIYDALPDVENLLLAADYREKLTPTLPALRGVVPMATTQGLPVPAMASSLAYLDGMRSARLSANVIEAMRDRFGGHGFGRLDKPGRSTFPWPRGDEEL